MKIYWLIAGILAVWRVTHLLQAEDGPWDVVVRLRRAVGNGVLGKLLDCFYCLSLWISAPLAWWLGEDGRERFLLWLSFSAGASLLQQFTTRDAGIPAAPFVEETSGKEQPYGMLWTEEKSADDPAKTGSNSGPERPAASSSNDPAKGT